MAAATDLLAQISARVAETIDDVKAQAADYERVRAELEPYRQLANLLTAQYFGVEVSEKELLALGRYVIVNKTIPRVPAYDTVLDKARELAQEQKWLHWKLEFPEIYFTKDDSFVRLRSGFNAVVGNPPWGAPLDSKEREAITRLVKGRCGKNADSYVLFLVRSIELCDDEGYVGTIVPNTFLYNPSTHLVRDFTLGSCRIIHAAELGKQIFEDAPDVVPVMFFVKREGDEALRSSNKALVTLLGRSGRDLTRITKGIWREQVEIKQSLWASDEEKKIDLRLSPQRLPILAKIGSRSFPLGKIAKSTRGIEVGDDRHLADEQFDSNYKPVLGGSEIGRYEIKWRGRFVRYGDWLNNPVSSRVFEQPKIIWQQVRKLSMEVRLVGVLDTGCYYTTNTTALIYDLERGSSYSLWFVLGLFNSKLLNFWHLSSLIKSYRAKSHKVVPVKSLASIISRQVAGENGNASW